MICGYNLLIPIGLECRKENNNFQNDLKENKIDNFVPFSLYDLIK